MSGISGNGIRHDINSNWQWVGHRLTGGVYGTRHLAKLLERDCSSIGKLGHVAIGVVECIPLIGSVMAAVEGRFAGISFWKTFYGAGSSEVYEYSDDSNLESSKTVVPSEEIIKPSELQDKISFADKAGELNSFDLKEDTSLEIIKPSELQDKISFADKAGELNSFDLKEDTSLTRTAVHNNSFTYNNCTFQLKEWPYLNVSKSDPSGKGIRVDDFLKEFKSSAVKSFDEVSLGPNQEKDICWMLVSNTGNKDVVYKIFQIKEKKRENESSIPITIRDREYELVELGAFTYASSPPDRFDLTPEGETLYKERLEAREERG